MDTLLYIWPQYHRRHDKLACSCFLSFCSFLRKYCFEEVVQYFELKKSRRYTAKGYQFAPPCNSTNNYSLYSKMQVVLTFLDLYILLCTQTYVISRCITNTMNLEKPKRPTFWNGGSRFMSYFISAGTTPPPQWEHTQSQMICFAHIRTSSPLIIVHAKNQMVIFTYVTN